MASPAKLTSYPPFFYKALVIAMRDGSALFDFHLLARAEQTRGRFYAFRKALYSHNEYPTFTLAIPSVRIFVIERKMLQFNVRTPLAHSVIQQIEKELHSVLTDPRGIPYEFSSALTRDYVPNNTRRNDGS